MPSRSDRDTVPPGDGTSRFHRDEPRTRPSLPRTGVERQLPARGESEESDREVLLRTLAELEGRFDEKLEASRRLSAAPKPRDWGDLATKFVAALGVVAGAAGVLKPAPKDTRVDDAYSETAKAIKTLEAHQSSTDSSLEGLRAWIAGYLASTGVKVAEPRGAPPAAIVELQPAPLVSSDTITPRQAPAVQVRTPLPLPPASSKPIVLRPLKE